MITGSQPEIGFESEDGGHNMNRQKKATVIILALMLAGNHLFSFVGESAQQVEKEQVIQHNVSVSLKLIQVYVSDSQEKPVTDLKKKDFILFDNGKRMAVTDFESHLQAELSGSASASIGGVTRQQARLGRKFLFFLDVQHSDEIGLMQSSRAALHFIENCLYPGDEVAVLAFTPLRGLVLHEYFTSDREKMIVSVKSVGEIPDKERHQRNLDLADEMGKTEKAAADSLRAQRGAGSQIGLDVGGTSSNAWITNESSTREVRVKNYAGRKPVDLFVEIVALAKSLNYIPGYKNFVYFSGGADSSLKQGFAYLGKELAAANCPVFTIDSVGSRDNLGGRFQRKDGAVLEALSAASGGRFFSDVSDYRTIASGIQEWTGNYYVLGYYVPEAWDGEYHSLRVEVSRPGCRVHAQGGFFNPKPFEELSPFEKQLHLFDISMNKNPYHSVPERLGLTAFTCPTTTHSQLVMLLDIPLYRMREITADNTEVFTMIFDQNQRLVDVCRGEINFGNIKKERVCFYSITPLETGAYSCRAVLRNTRSGLSALGVTPEIRIPAPGAPGDQERGPLYFIPNEKADFMREDSAASGKKDKISLKSLFPFLTNSHRPLIDSLDRDQKRILAMAGFAQQNGKEPQVMVVSFLGLLENDSSPRRIEAKVLRREKKDGYVHLLFELTLPDVETGFYTLNWAVRNLETGSESIHSNPIQIF
jgi:VWFA-related protein